jgi:hypothetical protein
MNYINILMLIGAAVTVVISFLARYFTELLVAVSRDKINPVRCSKKKHRRAQQNNETVMENHVPASTWKIERYSLLYRMPGWTN